MKYGEGATEPETQRCAKSIGGLASLAGQQADAVQYFWYDQD